MTENLAGRGEGLAGLVAALNGVINERDTELDMMQCGYSSGVGREAWHDGVREAWTRFALVKERARQAMVAALEAAAPAGTAQVTKINDYGVLIREVEQAQGILKKVWDQLFYCERERDELGRALATPPPQAPQEQCNSFSTTSAREQSSATASVPLRHGVHCEKKPHVRDGYLHGEEDDTPYDVDGVKYCGRCHIWLDAPAAAQAHAEYFTDMIAGQAALDGATQPAGSGDALDRERREGLYLKFSEPMAEPHTPVIIERVNGDCTVSQFIIARDEAHELINQLCEFLHVGSPRKVGEDGAPMLASEHLRPQNIRFRIARAMAPVLPDEELRLEAANLAALSVNAALLEAARSSSVPVGEQKQEEGV